MWKQRKNKRWTKVAAVVIVAAVVRVAAVEVEVMIMRRKLHNAFYKKTISTCVRKNKRRQATKIKLALPSLLLPHDPSSHFLRHLDHRQYSVQIQGQLRPTNNKVPCSLSCLLCTSPLSTSWSLCRLVDASLSVPWLITHPLTPTTVLVYLAPSPPTSHTSPQPPKPNKTKLTSKHIIATRAGQSRYCPRRSLSRREPSFGHKRLEESFSCPL